MIDWKFIDKKKISKEKKELDLSEEVFNKWIKSMLELEKKDSVDDLLLLKLIKTEFKGSNYEAWRSNEIKYNKAFEEDGKYYYYQKINRVEYLVDITCTNKLGMTLKNKYIIVVEKESDKWKIKDFYER